MGCGAPARSKYAARNDDGATVPVPVEDDAPRHASSFVAHTGKFSEHYDIDKKKLGQGACGTVSKCTNKVTGKIRAVKTTQKKGLHAVANVKAEIALMKIMDHPNIIRIYASFEDNRNIYMVLELCQGGELLGRILESRFTELQAAVVMKDMFRAINYLHQQHICHRDLKPENFLFTSKDPIGVSQLKLIDFGVACKFEEGIPLTSMVGTPFYLAPDVLFGNYTHAVDLWSLGVIMFVILAGYPPFNGANDKEIFCKVKRACFSFNDKYWGNISEDAKNLIKNLLKTPPAARFTAAQALNDTWVKDNAPNASKTEIGKSLVLNLKMFRSQCKFKKAALHVIATHLGEVQIEALRDIFKDLDHSGDGFLTVSKLKEGIERAGLQDLPEDLINFLGDVDTDGSGYIDYTEFLAAALDERTYMNEDVCWQAFQVFDKNGDGKIQMLELMNMLNEEEGTFCGSGSLERIMRTNDRNSDGSVDFEEFKLMLRGSGREILASEGTASP
jgi:calcium-dependent protein kinase